MEKYGEFAKILEQLKTGLEEVRISWTDQIAQSYDYINENMKIFASEIWKYYNYSIEEFNLVKKYYDEYEYEKILNKLHSMEEEV